MGDRILCECVPLIRVGVKMKTVCDAAAICKAIAVDFKVKGLTHEIAASRLGCSKQTVSNQISGKKKFSLKSAQKYAETFGYNLEFLLFGKGELNGSLPATPVSDAESTGSEEGPSVDELKRQVRLAKTLFRILNNPDAIAAFDAVVSGNEKRYAVLLSKLHNDYGWDLSVEEIDRDQVDSVRKFLVEAQGWRLMGLIEKINHVCGGGGYMSAQSMLDVCKTEILKLTDEYPDVIINDLK